MFWFQQEAKYSQLTSVCYDSDCPEHFCKPGENWGAFTPEECDRIISLSAIMPKGFVNVSGKIDPEYRQVTMWRINYDPNFQWLWQKIANNIMIANNKWWNFDIYGITEPLQLLCYAADHGDGTYKDHYSKHVDVGGVTPNRKITFSIQLSEPKNYEGGELKLYRHRDAEIIPNSRGTMVLFPSYILHEVTPIVKGTRWALVCWASGPQFR